MSIPRTTNGDLIIHNVSYDVQETMDYVAEYGHGGFVDQNRVDAILRSLRYVQRGLPLHIDSVIEDFHGGYMRITEFFELFGVRLTGTADNPIDLDSIASTADESYDDYPLIWDNDDDMSEVGYTFHDMAVENYVQNLYNDEIGEFDDDDKENSA